MRDLDHDHGRHYDEPETLFDDYAGRGIAEHDQDMTIEKTMNAKDLKLTPPPQLTPEQRKQWDAYYDSRIAEYKAKNLTGADLVHWKYQCYMHDYLGCIRGVDDSVGRILKYLDDEGLASNTIVVYASDQGFYLGEHGWFDKRWIFEESLRTPLLVRWPGVVKPGSVNNDLVSNLDFAETFLEAAGQAGAARDARAQSHPDSEGRDPCRLAQEFLLSLLRVSPASSRTPAIRGRDRSL